MFALLEMHRHLESVIPALEFVLMPSRSGTRSSSGGGGGGGGGGEEEDPGRRSSGADSTAEGISTLSSVLLQEYNQLQLLVAKAAASIFGEYEEVVAKDASKILPPDGTIHPLTAQVLSYVKVRRAAHL